MDFKNLVNNQDKVSLLLKKIHFLLKVCIQLPITMMGKNKMRICND